MSIRRRQFLLLYLPTQIRFLIGGERVTCHWSKLHDALGRTKLHDALGQQQLELSTHTWSGRAPLKRRQICTPADVKQIIFICVLFYFELGGITKHLMTGPSGNSEFCFPSTSIFLSASPRGTLRVSGKQNSWFPLGPVIKCLIFLLSTARTSTIYISFNVCVITRLGMILHQKGHGHSHGLKKKKAESKKTQASPSSFVIVEEEENVNVRAAFIHVLGDFLQSVGVFIAALLIWFKASIQPCFAFTQVSLLT